MNIFFLDSNIKKCAEYHVDKHVVKMRLELAQLASAAHWLNGSEAPYKPTHRNHPSNIWVRESLSNYKYVVDLGLALCEELKFRFNTKEQKCEQVLIWLRDNKPNIQDIGLTAPKLAMDESFKVKNIISDNAFNIAIENYRNYYKFGKIHLFKWTNREKPLFI